jgi:hypothetical protein
MHILDLPTVKASDKPHVNAASITGPHDLMDFNCSDLYLPRGERWSNSASKENLFTQSEFPPGFPASNHLSGWI